MAANDLLNKGIAVIRVAFIAQENDLRRSQLEACGPNYPTSNKETTIPGNFVPNEQKCKFLIKLLRSNSSTDLNYKGKLEKYLAPLQIKIYH